MNPLNNNNNNINILDLPNEILLTIFKKMKKIDVLYSLVNVNEQLNQLIFDPLYIDDLDLTIKSLFDKISPIDNQILDRICDEILPEISDKVNKLTIEPLSMERILHSGQYSQLHSLSLLSFEYETILKHLTGETILNRLLTNQIISLKIEIEDIMKNELNIFVLIISMCKNLKDLTFSQCFTDENCTITFIDLPSRYCISSTLTKLNIYVNSFDDCLYLLDGHFQSLSTLMIDILNISRVLSNIDNTKNLPKLKCFSLTSYSRTSFYDNQIVPLLHRMLNLEELTLFISVIRIELTYIDGIHLYDEILLNMVQLNKFTFSILSRIKTIKTDLPSNDDIQRSFIGRTDKQIGSYINKNLFEMSGECHVYSLPYQFDSFPALTNAFPGGKFDKVTWLLMCDRYPFEPNLFEIISQDFPFLEILVILNFKSQHNKQDLSRLITFPHLIELEFHLTHQDYVEQFLFLKKTFLPRLLSLEIEYETLAIITNNFTNDESRLCCAQLKRLIIKEPFVPPENFHSYFPLL